jgi:hypothetical protein
MTASPRHGPVQPPSTEWLPVSDDQSYAHLVSCHRYSTGDGYVQWECRINCQRLSNGPGVLDPPVVLDDGALTVNAAVIGGDWTMAGSPTFTSSVGPNTMVGFEINDSAKVVADRPNEFNATINLQPNYNAVAPAAYTAELVGLAHVDSYTLNNDLLSPNGSNGRALDTVRLAAGSLAPQVFEDAGNAYLAWGGVWYGHAAGRRSRGPPDAGPAAPDLMQTWPACRQRRYSGSHSGTSRASTLVPWHSSQRR